MSNLIQAKTEEEIWKAVDLACRKKNHPDTDCRGSLDKDTIPAWFPNCPREARREANKCLTATLGATAVWFQIRTEIIAVVISLNDPCETLNLVAVQQAWIDLTQG